MKEINLSAQQKITELQDIIIMILRNHRLNKNQL